MSFMMAFGWVSIMLLIGVILRAKVAFLRNMLVPASVIAGILGLVFVNAAEAGGMNVGTDTGMYTDIVSNLFTVSFISIALTRKAGGKGSGETAKNVVCGSLSMGLVWCLLYALTPMIGVGILSLLGSAKGMGIQYGMLIQFGFCQGPGQAASYGTILESYGWENAATVGISFAAIGFIAAFLVGIPAARLGIKIGIAKHSSSIDGSVVRGYYKKDEQPETKLKETTSNSNIESLAFHFCIIGLCFIFAVGISRILSLIPGFIGTSMSGMMFMNGMYAGYIMRFVLKKLKIDYLLDDMLQSKITSWATDYLVACSFMAVSIRLIKAWVIPILVVAIVTSIVTFIICFYFGRHMGGSYDFERTLGLYGTCTGTVPSGISLVRIVDPNFKTTTSVELGGMNITMLACTPVMLLIMAFASGTIGMAVTVGGLAACCVLYLVLMLVTRSWRIKPSYEWHSEKNA